MSGCLCGVDESFGQRVLVIRVGYGEGAADAVILVFASLLILGLAEIRQHVFIAPPGVSELAPLVVIFFMAADIDHAVDGTGTT